MELDGRELEYNINWLAQGLGCEIIVLDHLTMVTYDMGGETSERKDIDILMKGLRRLTKETNCSILNVCHLKRPSGQAGWDQGREISLTDLRGSAAIGQLSDAVIGLERNLQNESLKNKTLVKILKNRVKGSTGLADSLYYDELTGRLVTVDQLFK
jgi:twinkle protein